MDFRNTYEDDRYAAAYATLEFRGTYHLAFRDLPAIFAAHVRGRRALDFGCGAGRSTRFLRALGYEATGVDVSPDMIAQAASIDPGGDYRLVPDGDLRALPARAFDLTLAAFPFDNMPTLEGKVASLRALGERLAPGGRLVNLVSSPEIYTHEWVSFSTRDYPENRQAKSGDRVRIVITDIPDARPVEDVVWTHESYLDTYARAGLEVLETRRPLARGDEPCAWVNETRIAPWVIYVLRNAAQQE